MFGEVPLGLFPARDERTEANMPDAEPKDQNQLGLKATFGSAQQSAELVSPKNQRNVTYNQATFGVIGAVQSCAVRPSWRRPRKSMRHTKRAKPSRDSEFDLSGIGVRSFLETHG